MEAGVRWFGTRVGWIAALAVGAVAGSFAAGCGGNSSITSSEASQTAAPAFSPGGGSYTSAQSVKITSATAGAVLYCTTDGTTPTTSSPQCPSTATVLSSEYLQAIAVAPGLNASPVTAAGYSIGLPPVSAPAFSPAGGNYTSPQQVTISDATSGANIYYTTNGTTPTAASTHYTGPIPVSANQTVNAIAVASEYSNSAIASATYTISAYPAATPTLYPGGGTYPGPVTVTLSDTTNGATIYYTIDGSKPTTNSAVYSSSNPITVSSTAAIQAIAVASGYTTSAVATAGYVIETSASTPTFSLASGTYTTTQTVTLVDALPGATIYYCVTTTTCTPTTSSPQYSGAIAVSNTETINAIAVVTGYLSSTEASATYSITPAAAAPIFSVGTGTYSTVQTVTLSDTTPNATIYYTTNGTAAATSSTVYMGSITVSSSQTINAVAIASGYSVSADAYAIYTVNLTQTLQPVLSAQTGVYGPGFAVTITDATQNAVIHYTLDGTPANANSTPYNGPIVLTNDGSYTLDVVAIAPGLTLSPDALAVYTISPPANAPTFNVASGAYTTPQSVTIGDTTRNAAIYYTTDSSTPTINSPVYNGPIAVSSTDEVINAIAAVASGAFSPSSVTSVEIRVFGGVIAGKAMSGSTPIAGAAMQLYSAGTTGYSSAPIAAATYSPSGTATGSDGSFALYYDCPAAPQDQMYLVATGGSTGSGTNQYINLMSALGSCASLPASVTVNEVTTIASVYALSAFASIDSAGGISVGAPATYDAVKAPLCSATATPAWQSTGADTCNYNGLVNAFKAVNNLVNVANGQALTYTPAYPTNLAGDPNIVNNSTVPTTRINALANMLASCVESNKADCGSSNGLFNAATPTSGGTKPADTLQAALNIAQNPGGNGVSVNTLLDLVPTSNPPYSPTLDATALSASTPPTDLTLALTFTGGGLGISPNLVLNDNEGPVINLTMAIDAAGNIWVAGCKQYPTEPSTCGYGDMLAGFNGLGAPLTSATTVSTNGKTETYGGFNPEPAFSDGAQLNLLAIDQSGYLWASDEGAQRNMLQISYSLLPPPNLNVKQSFMGPGDSYITIDSSGDLWMVGYNSVDEYENNGSNSYTKNSEVASDFNEQLSNLAFDSQQNLWAAGRNSNYNDDVFQLNKSNGSAAYDMFPTSSGNFLTTLVADGTGNVYGCDPNGNLAIFYTSDNKPAVKSIGQIQNTGPSPYGGSQNRACGNQLVLDGQGHIFSVVNSWGNPPGTAIDEFNVPALSSTATSIPTISPSVTGYTGSSSVEGIYTLDPDPNLGGSSGAAIDSSGNLWVLNNDTSGGYYDANFNVVTTPGNVLVEYVGIAAPVLNPASVALANGVLGARP